MRSLPIPRRLSTLLLAAALGGHAAHAADPPDPAETAFLAENVAAMNRMMDDMAVQTTGDIDRDFVAMMIPHHQGAIDMAQAVLRYGRNEQIRRIAQEIIVEQQQEIVAMRLALGDPLPAAAPAPDKPAAPTPAHHHHGSH
ncbi:DUF305 domain-containing protein [Neoroseomonas lacus]|uniref:DUF305 domain-containing protein n=1 Tax=Neoroseomonas lacus TaxID=287609 RepID=A0A917L3B3_9PROT|nr:DUF305 domain-containing protein [Neoroseomonas lacus]GGJ42717.1 hypothetical protein GCM10011320_57930 [Neoroseomonas lacus]